MEAHFLASHLHTCPTCGRHFTHSSSPRPPGKGVDFIAQEGTPPKGTQRSRDGRKGIASLPPVLLHSPPFGCRCGSAYRGSAFPRRRCPGWRRAGPSFSLGIPPSNPSTELGAGGAIGWGDLIRFYFVFCFVFFSSDFHKICAFVFFLTIFRFLLAYFLNLDLHFFFKPLCPLRPKFMLNFLANKLHFLESPKIYQKYT